MSRESLQHSKRSFTTELKTDAFLQLGLDETAKRLKRLGLTTDSLLDPDDSFDRQVAILRHNYLLAERSSLSFNISDPNFWRMLRARLQPMILAYQTHEKFVQGLEGDALSKKLKQMMEVYRGRLETTEQFKQLFFQVSDEQPNESTVVKTQTAQSKASGGVVDIQGNVINQLKESLKEHERNDKKLERTIKEQQEALFKQEKLIEKQDAKNAELLAEIERLSTENLQLKVSIDAANKHGDQVAGSMEIAQTDLLPADERVIPETQSDNQLADNSALVLKIESLERDLENTSSAAYNAFMANSDLGIVILFIMSAFRCQTISQLSGEINRSLKTYGMTSVFKIKTDAGVEFYGDGKVSEAEKNYINTNDQGDRVVDLGKNYLIYDERTALLVKDMPIEDAERCARLKDNLNTLMQGAENSANLITLSQSAELQKKRMESLLLRSDDVFKKLAANFERSKKTCDQGVRSFYSELSTQLKMQPGSPQSKSLNASFKRFEAGLSSCFEMDKMVDTTFVKNVSKVVSTIKT